MKRFSGHTNINTHIYYMYLNIFDSRVDVSVRYDVDQMMVKEINDNVSGGLW